MGRRSTEEQIRQLAALPPDVLVKQIRMTHVFQAIGTTVVLAAISVYVFFVNGGEGIMPEEPGPDPAVITAVIAVAMALAGWVLSRPWRAALVGTNPPTDRRDLAVRARQGLLGLFVTEGGAITAAIAFLLGGGLGLFAMALLTLALVLFQRTDADRAADLARHLEGDGNS